MYPDTVIDDVRLTRYRLQAIEQWPDSPEKATLLNALRRRLDWLAASSDGQWRGDCPDTSNERVNAAN